MEVPFNSSVSSVSSLLLSISSSLPGVKGSRFSSLFFKVINKLVNKRKILQLSTKLRCHIWFLHDKTFYDIRYKLKECVY